MRPQKARPLGELRRKAVRGHNVRSKTLSVTQACHLSQSERLFEISIFRWDNVLRNQIGVYPAKSQFIFISLKLKRLLLSIDFIDKSRPFFHFNYFI